MAHFNIEQFMNEKVGVGLWMCLAVCFTACDKDKVEDASPTEAEANATPRGNDKEDAPTEEAKPKVAKIEGDCVSDIKADAIARLTKKVEGDMEADEIEERLEVSDFDDIDGDGAPEKEAALFAYASNLEIVLYLSNSGCALPVGEFMATSLTALDEDEKPNGIGRVRTWTKGGCAGLEGDYVTYAFDAATKKMKSGALVSCSCEVTEGRPPECPTPE